jgi:hypothetical protein
MRLALLLLLVGCAEPPPVERGAPAPVVAPAPEILPQIAPEPPPPPPEPPAPRADFGPACSDDWSCVLVTGGCRAPAAAHVSVASEIDEANHRQLSVAECVGGPSTPVRPACSGEIGEPVHCVARVLDHPEWRTCERDRDCTLEPNGCHHWEAVNTRSSEAARAAWMPAEPCPGIFPPMPEVRCRYGFCAGPWGGR